MTYAIGIDIGGTQLRCAAIDATGKMLAQHISLSRAQEDSEILCQTILAAIANIRKNPLVAKYTLCGVGIGMAGLVDGNTGVIHRSPHFPNIHAFPLKKALSETLALPISIDNDANCIAVGEAWQGAAQDWTDFMCITLGTGIGGAFFRNGRIDRGRNGFAGEIGHITVDYNGTLCPCGNRGCWETIASGSALPKLIRTWAPTSDLLQQPGESLGPILLMRAQNRDPLALEIYRRFGENMAIGLASLIAITGITRIVISGGISAAKDYFLPSLTHTLPTRTYILAYSEKPDLVFSTLLPWGGCLGAVKEILGVTQPI